jgi:flagellar L-ring protein precursor FlgH
MLNLEKYYPSSYIPKSFPYLNPFARIKAAMESEFEGSGTTGRSGSIAAVISVRIVEVMPNGNLKIAGSREISINNERQYITLTGFVRPADIPWNNTVLSTYISDARIVYSGSGVINDRQRPGWMLRILDAVWPF